MSISPYNSAEKKLNFNQKVSFLPIIKMSECNVCAESFNKTKRAKVTCRCDYEACRSCIKTYLLDKTEDAHCMSCKVGWDRKFMASNFEVTFMTKNYKSHREQILIERELSMLQATQPYVEREIKLEKLNLAMDQLTKKYFQERKDLQDEYQAVSENTTVERKKFVRKCPNGDCHGFLSSALKCELCEKFACRDCREVTGKTTEERENHACDPQIVESVKFLEKDSKPCPKCASLTFKTVGCNSMWCVECHSSWNWVSGKIESGTIHNPEYFDWLKKQNGGVPRNPNDIICGREIDNNFIIRLLQVFPRGMAKDWIETTNWRGQIEYYKMKTNERTTVYPFKNGTNEHFAEIARNIIHIRHVEVPRFQEADRLQDNLQMRIDFMRNKIDKYDFKKKIQKKEKEVEKKREINNVLGMYINCMTDIFYRLVDKPNTKKIQVEMDALRDYVNDSLKRISTTFNSKRYEINKDFVFCAAGIVW
jgi:hypothetical protein